MSKSTCLRFNVDSRRGFTLIELLVVVAVIAILIGILLPALGRARGAAQQLQSNSTKRQLMIGLLTYASENDQWLPGINTSGKRLQGPVSAQTIDLLGQRSGMPVQINDWMTMALGGSDLPSNREHRFFTLLDRFRDPAMRENVPVWVAGGPGNREMDEWLELNGKPSIPATSYLMPMNFQLAGEKVLGMVMQTSGSYANLRRQHINPENYVPRLDRVGAASKKIGIADGFRFVNPTEFDVDCAYTHGNWGSFGDRSPCSTDSTAWGRGSSTGGGGGLGLPFSYRHGGTMGAAFFDGHTDALDKRASRNPTFWAPSGSIFVGGAGTDRDSYDFIRPRGFENATGIIP